MRYSLKKNFQFSGLVCNGWFYNALGLVLTVISTVKAMLKIDKMLGIVSFVKGLLKAQII